MRTKLMTRVGKAIAEDFFLMMLNPKYRGPNFKWEEFAEMIGHHAYVMSGTAAANITEKEQEVAKKAAYNWAVYALKRSGLLGEND